MELQTLSGNAEFVSNPMAAANSKLPGAANRRVYKPSTDELQDWLDKHGHRLSSSTGNKIFTDANGVQRYENTWKVVDMEKLESQSNTVTSLGYITYNFVSRKGVDKSVKLLLDWEKLWRHYEEDSADELAVQAPMLRLFLELFFHERTTQIMFFACFYDLFLMLVVNGALGGNDADVMILSEVLLICVQLFAYANLKILYGGSLFRKLSASHKREDLSSDSMTAANDDNDDDPNKKLASSKGSLPLMSSVIQVCKFSCGELRQLIRRGCRNNRKKEGNRLHYYNLLNISLKFLTVHHEINVSKINYNRVSYRVVLLFVSFLLPIYVFRSSVLSLFAPCLMQGASGGLHCEYVLYIFGFSICGLTNFLQFLIFSGSVLVAFVGLAYGGETAHQLTNVWLTRFNDLRRVVKPGAASSSDNSSSSSNGSVDGDDAVLKTVGDGAEEGPVTDDEFAACLSRDAYEQYLLYAEFMKQAGALWSAPIVGLIIYLMYLLSGVIVILINPEYRQDTTTLAGAVVYTIIRVSILLIYPIISIAHANSYLYAMHDTFRMSAPGDFSILGGRDSWNTFLQAVPAVWTVFGLWVTWDRMFALLWAMTTAGVAVAITVISSSL